jgi:hypothetical protein
MSCATSSQQGGIALLWTEEHQHFEVEAVNIVSPNMSTFQLVMGGVHFFVMGAYIPPADTMGVDDLCNAWAKCPANCKLLLLGDLNINFGSLCSKREEIIADLLNEMNLANMSRKFQQRIGQQQGWGVQWTWRQRRGGQWHQSQPDYCTARDGDAKLFRGVAFQWPWIHDLDHRAVVALILRGQPGWLKLYCQYCQRYPMQLPPVEEQDEQTHLFRELRKTCEEETPMRHKKNDWILEESWRLNAHLAMLRRTGRLCQTRGHHLHHQVSISLHKDQADQTSHVGTMIESELTGGNVQEAICHLKGWYWATSEMQAKLCYQTLECQTLERVNLYARRNLPGDPLQINITPVKINNDAPSDGKLRQVMGELTNCQAVGASGMRAKHVKEWLCDMQREEDPEGQGAEGAGDSWPLFVQLVQTAWTHGVIPHQLLWSIVVLIPKGGGDYRGIGLLEPIWKC